MGPRCQSSDVLKFGFEQYNSSTFEEQKHANPRQSDKEFLTVRALKFLSKTW